tara:strand:+ start:4909 stop:5169 length:261 start_codon:yes stop_codon:yes gene_type:complete
MSLKSNKIRSISKKVYKKFPDLKNVTPTILEQSLPNVGNSKDTNPTSHYQITYKTIAQLPDGNTMNKIVKVLANSNGKIIKMSLSK